MHEALVTIGHHRARAALLAPASAVLGGPTLRARLVLAAGGASASAEWLAAFGSMRVSATLDGEDRRFALRHPVALTREAGCVVYHLELEQQQHHSLLESGDDATAG